MDVLESLFFPRFSSRVRGAALMLSTKMGNFYFRLQKRPDGKKAATTVSISLAIQESKRKMT